MNKTEPLGLPTGSVHAISMLTTLFVTLVTLAMQELATGSVQWNFASKALVTMSAAMLYLYDSYRRHAKQIDIAMEALRTAQSGGTPPAPSA